MAGTIYCLPNLIADGTLEAAIPSAVRTRAADIRLFFVEAAKNARAYLKLLGHPGPISEPKSFNQPEIPMVRLP